MSCAVYGNNEATLFALQTPFFMYKTETLQLIFKIVNFLYSTGKLRIFMIYYLYQTHRRIYSMVETAKANGMELYRYLHHILTELPYLRNPRPMMILIR